MLGLGRLGGPQRLICRRIFQNVGMIARWWNGNEECRGCGADEASGRSVSERKKSIRERERERERKRERGVSRRRAEDMSCGIKAKPCEIARKPRSFNKPGPAAVVRGGSWWILILIWNKSSLFRGSVNATRNATRRPGYETVGWKGKGGEKKISSPLCPIGNDILSEYPRSSLKKKPTSETSARFCFAKIWTECQRGLQFPRRVFHRGNGSVDARFIYS